MGDRRGIAQDTQGPLAAGSTGEVLVGHPQCDLLQGLHEPGAGLLHLEDPGQVSGSGDRRDGDVAFLCEAAGVGGVAAGEFGAGIEFFGGRAEGTLGKVIGVFFEEPDDRFLGVGLAIEHRGGGPDPDQLPVIGVLDQVEHRGVMGAGGSVEPGQDVSDAVGVEGRSPDRGESGLGHVAP